MTLMKQQNAPTFVKKTIIEVFILEILNVCRQTIERGQT